MKKEEMRELKNIFEEHGTILTSLSECLQGEKEALVKDDTSALTDIVEKKVKCVESLDEMERSRQVRYGHINLQYLEEILDEEWEDDEIPALAEELKKQMYHMRDIGRQMLEDQETNSLLLEQNKAYGDMMMQTIQEMIKKSGTYGKSGKIEQAPVKAGLDTSV